MEQDIESELEIGSTSRRKSPALRLRRIIILETMLVALAGALVWGLVWEMGYPRAGLGAAIVIWLSISPAIEIATVMKYRKDEDGEE